MANEPLPDGVTMKDLECVMVDVEHFDIAEAMIGYDNYAEDLYYGDPDGDPRVSFAQGAVAEDNPHFTLLFGIHPSERYEMDVYEQLYDWDLPDHVIIDEVGFFPSTVEGEDYNIIVGHLVHTAPILAANKRLAELPHTNQHPYRPHITLAYIKGSAPKDEWISRLQSAFGHKFIKTVSLNLGNEDD